MFKMGKNWVIISFVLAVSLSNILPFVIQSSNDQVFIGISYNVVDTNTYLSFMKQAGEGHFLFSNKYSPESIPYIIFNPVYLLIGWLAYFIGSIAAYYLAKISFLIIFIYLVGKLLELSVRKEELPIAYFFVLFGSGIGWILVLLSKIGFKQYGSIDLWLSESNSIVMNIAPVHMVISVCLMMAIVICYYKFWETKSKSYFITFSFLTLLLGFIHLFDVITLIIAFGIYSFWRIISKKGDFMDIIKYNLIYGLIISPSFFYTYRLFAANSLIAAWNAQNLLPSPKLTHIIFGFFLPILFAIVYFIYKMFNKIKFSSVEVILFSWIISGILLLYSPFNIQRRFIEGLNVPIMILGSLGFARTFLPQFQRRFYQITKLKIPKGVFVGLICAIIMPTSLYWIYEINSNVKPYVQIDDYDVPYYLDKSELEALNWLRSNTNTEEVVLSSYGIGNYIPRISGNRVFLGHWAQTIDFNNKKQLVNKFYSTNDESFKKKLIQDYSIDYVYYGVEEKKLGTFTPVDMKKVFENDKVMIFKVN